MPCKKGVLLYGGGLVGGWWAGGWWVSGWDLGQGGVGIRGLQLCTHRPKGGP